MLRMLENSWARTVAGPTLTGGLLIVFLAISITTAQANQNIRTLVSNTGQTSSTDPDTFSVVGLPAGGSQRYSVAQRCRTGDHESGYRLLSVGVFIAGFDASDSDDVSIHAVDASGNPGAKSYGLFRPTSNGFNPFYSNSSSVLESDTDYFVVFEATTGAFEVELTSSDAEDTGEAAGWSIGNGVHVRSSDTGRWTVRALTLRMQVKGRPIVNNAAPVLVT